SALSSAGLQLNGKKCHFAAREIKVLGHVVTGAGIRPDPDKLAAVSDFPLPSNVKELQSFLGLCSYFRRFINNFATLAHPLHALLRKDSWSSDAQMAFSSLKNALTSHPVLAHYDPLAYTELQ